MHPLSIYIVCYDASDLKGKSKHPKNPSNHYIAISSLPQNSVTSRTLESLGLSACAVIGHLRHLRFNHMHLDGAILAHTKRYSKNF